MEFYRPDRVLAGFHADHPEPGLPELTHVGEQWAPTHLVIAPHHHDVWEFYLQLEGSSRWADDRGAYTVPAGALFIAPARVRHWMPRPPVHRHHYVFAGIDLQAVLARHPALRDAWRTAAGGPCLLRTRAEGVHDAFRQLVRESCRTSTFRPQVLRLILDWLVLEATRLLTAQQPRALLPIHPAVAQCRDLLATHPRQPWRLADLARLTGLSPNHLASLFARQLGTSPHRFLLQQRLDLARQTLRDSDLPITHLAIDLGFSSSQHFATTFRAAEGCSPAQFRRMHREGDAPRRGSPPRRRGRRDQIEGLRD